MLPSLRLISRSKQEDIPMPSQFLRVLPLILLSLILSTSSAGAQNSSQDGRLIALESKLVDLETAQISILGRLDQLWLDLDNTLEPLRVRLAEYGANTGNLESRLAALEEQLALLNENLLSIAGGSREPDNASARQVSGSPMPPPQQPAGVPGPSVARPAASAQPPPVPTKSEADSLHSAAYTDYLSANYTLAIDSFQQYLRLFPDGSLADSAQYWIGESHYSLQQYQLARTAFMEVERRYPGSQMAPDATFKAARCLIELGEGAQAISELIRLVTDHPSSNAVPIACMQIERLGGEKPAGCPGN